ncbi:MAG TPA: methyltransferase domain-containing protein [Pyrinomonadaceae bacterium]|nr:methyltransferase domain-containing protein [Pyrinomonadaceae bacterium]
MARGQYLTRLQARRLDPQTAAFYRMWWPSRQLYERPEQFPPLTALSLFGAGGPLTLEIGCGAGEFLCALASRDAAGFHLGVDTARKPLDHAAATAAEMELSNVRFLQADVKLLAPLLAAGSLASVFIHFPVPFSVSRQRKHQTYSPYVFDHLHRALIPGGRVSLLTDDRDVSRQVARAIGRDARFRLIPPDEWRFTFDEELKSSYHRRWERRGRDIFRHEIEKTA